MNKHQETETESEMVLAKRVGTILKEARESRKLTLRDVSRETNITPRFIEALENEDYSQFPGETYALGFLRNYADHLNLDTEHLLNLYRGLQIDQTQAPIKELTKPTAMFNMPQLPQIDRNVALAIAGAVVIVIIVILFATDAIHLPSSSDSSDKAGVTSVCDNREIIAVNIPQQGAPPRVENLSASNALKFSSDSLSMKLCLIEIKKDAARIAASFSIRINDETDFSFSAAQGETVILGPEIRELEGLTKKIKITPEVLGDVAARVKIESGEQVNVVPDKAAVTTGDIQVTLQFINESFVKWVDDGNFHNGISIAAGETRTLEAKNRLEITIGNGGGVRIIREGVQPRVAGPPNRVVKIIYKKAPDPLDPGIFKIQEAFELQ